MMHNEHNNFTFLGGTVGQDEHTGDFEPESKEEPVVYVSG